MRANSLADDVANTLANSGLQCSDEAHAALSRLDPESLPAPAYLAGILDNARTVRLDELGLQPADDETVSAADVQALRALLQA